MYLGVSKSQTCSVHQYKHGGLLRHKKLNENDYRKKKKKRSHIESLALLPRQQSYHSLQAHKKQLLGKNTQ